MSKLVLPLIMVLLAAFTIALLAACSEPDGPHAQSPLADDPCEQSHANWREAHERHAHLSRGYSRAMRPYSDDVARACERCYSAHAAQNRYDLDWYSSQGFIERACRIPNWHFPAATGWGNRPLEMHPDFRSRNER